MLDKIKNLFVSDDGKLYSFIYDLVEKYGIIEKYKAPYNIAYNIKDTPYWIAKNYGYNKFNITILSEDKLYKIEGEYYNSLYNGIIRKEEERQEKMKKELQSKEMDVFIMEGRLKYLESINKTGEFDDVFADVRRFQEITKEANEIYKKYSNHLNL